MARRRGVSRETQRQFRRAARRIERYAREMEEATPVAVRQISEEVMTDVKASRPGAGVPRDLGTLEGSSRVDGPDRLNLVTLSFGGPAAPYALAQHERLDYHHDVGEARYLVRGLERWRPDGSAAIQALKANARQGARIASRS